jgi:hypothetical protein
MVAAINAGILQGLFSVRGENNWPAAADGEPYVFRFTVDNIPAVASVADIGYDELSIHVAFWPTVGSAQFVSASGAGFYAGELFAYGWLERREGAWLMERMGRNLFCRTARPAIAAALVVNPMGYVDRGPFR